MSPFEFLSWQKFNVKSVAKCKVPVIAFLQFRVIDLSSMLQYLRGMFPFITGSATFFLLLPIVITQNGSIILSYVRNIRQFSDIKWIFISASEPLVEQRVVFSVRKEAKSFELQQRTETWRWNSGISPQRTNKIQTHFQFCAVCLRPNTFAHEATLMVFITNYSD